MGFMMLVGSCGCAFYLIQHSHPWDLHYRESYGGAHPADSYAQSSTGHFNLAKKGSIQLTLLREKKHTSN